MNPFRKFETVYITKFICILTPVKLIVIAYRKHVHNEKEIPLGACRYGRAHQQLVVGGGAQRDGHRGGGRAGAAQQHELPHLARGDCRAGTELGDVSVHALAAVQNARDGRAALQQVGGPRLNISMNWVCCRSSAPKQLHHKFATQFCEIDAHDVVNLASEPA